MIQHLSKPDTEMEYASPGAFAAGDEDVPRSGSPHYRRARRDRGARTRAQLIEAALDVFGRLGYEGASTREIAKAADANLAAIVYHFGGKQALHIAVAEHVVTGILAKVGPVLASADDPTAIATPAAARRMLHRMIETMVDGTLGSTEAERWARFIIREQLQPTAAFEVIYRFMERAAKIATRIVATGLGQPEDDSVRLRVLAMLGQVFIFRFAQPLVLRRMAWRTISEQEREAIKQVLHQTMDAILDGARS